jgi:hypothetical protein
MSYENKLSGGAYENKLKTIYRYVISYPGEHMKISSKQFIDMS